MDLLEDGIRTDAEGRGAHSGCAVPRKEQARQGGEGARRAV